MPIIRTSQQVFTAGVKGLPVKPVITAPIVGASPWWRVTDWDAALKTTTTISKNRPVSKKANLTFTITTYHHLLGWISSILCIYLFIFPLFKKHRKQGWLWNARVLFKMPHLSNLWPAVQVISHHKIKVRRVNAIFLQQESVVNAKLVFSSTQTRTTILLNN